MATPEQRLQELGITLPAAPSPIANYVPAVRTGDLLYLSGNGPAKGPDGQVRLGKLGKDMTTEEGYESARLVGVNIISRLKAELGDLQKVARIVKVLSMVNSTPDFTDQPAVINGFSDLMVEVFGEAGRHARSAVGMASLPMGIPVEIEMIVEVSDVPTVTGYSTSTARP